MKYITFLYDCMIVIYCALFRNCRWKFKNDFGYDLDHYLKICHPRHIRRGDDCQGGSIIVVPTQNRPVQEC